MTGIILEGLTLGLSAGIYCAGSCLVFFVPYLFVEGRQQVAENVKKILSFMAGRFIAYISFALAMGYLGEAHRNIFTARSASMCLIAASLFMLVYSIGHNFSSSVLCAGLVRRFSLMRIPFFLGIFTGLNPCPPFLVGAARLWTLNDALGGVVLFAAFFLGTSVYMIPIAFVSYLNRSQRIRQIGLMVALLSSVWFLLIGIAGAIK